MIRSAIIFSGPVLHLANPHTTHESILPCLSQPSVYSAVGSRSIAKMRILLGGPHLPDAQVIRSPSTNVARRKMCREPHDCTEDEWRRLASQLFGQLGGETAEGT